MSPAKIAPTLPNNGVVSSSGAQGPAIVTLKEARAMVLLVTLDKGSLSVGGHYTDHFTTPTRFVWQSQTSTLRDSLRGRILSGEEPGWSVHLFLRKSKLRGMRRLRPIEIVGSSRSPERRFSF